MCKMDFILNFVDIFCHWIRNLQSLKENVADRIVIRYCLINEILFWQVTNSNYVDCYILIQLD